MSYADSFRMSADALIRKMSAGDFTIKELIEEYDTDSGEITTTFTDKVVPGAMDEINSNYLAKKDFSKASYVLIVSGLSLGTFVPSFGCKVTSPFGEEGRVVAISYDQYKAHYSLGVAKL